MKKCIINLTPTGMIPTKSMTPFVPVTPQEIINDVLECNQLGISMVHLHARDAEGKAAYQKDIYSAIIEGIRSKARDLVIVVSTSGREFKDFEQRSNVLNLDHDLKPDMASLTLGSLNFNRAESVSSPSMIMKLAAFMQDHNIKPELEVFDLGMMNFAHYLIKKGLLTPPYYFNILLGNISSAQAKLSHLSLIISELPEHSYWCLGGIGSYQKEMNAMGLLIADGVRVGLEDNIWYDQDRSVLATNKMLVSRLIIISNALDRQIATPAEVRRKLQLKPIL